VISPDKQYETDTNLYNPSEIEKKWQSIWTENKLYKTEELTENSDKFYALSMFPYPSGNLHMGHVRNYVITDLIARFQRFKGKSVLHPMGWDAFGLPAENAAIERGISPSVWTKKNISHMKSQLKLLGLSVDWDREFATCDENYYVWTQYLFLELYKAGLVYQKESEVNWDPIDNTVLANEQVDSEGKSWRSGALVEKKLLKQWFLRITNYADELLNDLEKLDNWPERVKIMQDNWIGKSIGTNINFNINTNPEKKITVFTTRPDTLFGVTYLAISVNHSLIKNISDQETIEDIENKSKEEIELIKDQIKKQNHQNILEIRQVIQSYGDVGKIYLGGIPMIADDMMTFIKSDIIVFGLGVLLFIIATLWFVFRNLLWIVVPISSCLFSVIIMMGLLGLLGWKVTVISSNFIALMLILTMAMNIHMSTRFLQLKKDFPSKNNFEIISLTTSKMFWPILYTVLTTIFAFLSLIFSEIKPIIDFGWMMTFGLITSFIITFTLLPTLLNFAPTNNISLKKEQKSKITNLLGLISLNNKNSIFLVSGIVIMFSVIGISKLEVENSFINYFDKNTEIYKGMKLIDEELGGTTPLEIIIKFPEKKKVKKSEEDDEFDDWGDEEDTNDEKYWFTKDKIDLITSVHNYLDSLPEIGKVLSFSSIIEVATQLNNNKPLGTLEMGVLYSKIPESIKTEIVDPYL